MKKILFGLSILASAAMPALAQDHTLVTYASHDEPHYVDVAPPGPSVGDQYTRYGNIRLALEGPIVGEYYSQATMIYLDEAAKKSARTYTHEVVLSEGTIFVLDVIQLDHGKPVAEGHQHEGAILGGTGEYAGIRGTYTLKMLPSMKAFKTTYSYWLGQ